MVQAVMTKSELEGKVRRAIGLPRKDMPKLHARLKELGITLTRIKMARTQGKPPSSTLYLEVLVHEPANPKTVHRHLQLNEKLEVLRDERVESSRMFGTGQDPRNDTGYFD